MTSIVAGPVSILLTHLLIISGILYFVIGIWCIKYRRVKPARIFIFLMLAAGLYSIGYYLQLKSPNIDAFLMWNKLKYVGLAFIPFLWLIFVLHYSDRDRKIKTYYWPLFLLIPCLTLGFVLLGGNSKLFYQSIEMRLIDQFAIAVIKPGIWAYIHFFFANIAIIAGLAILLVDFSKSNSYQRLRYLWLIIGALIPWIISLFLFINISPNEIDYAPFAMIITSLVFFWEISKLKLFSILPLARTRIFEVIDKGIIVIDKNNNVADINPSAKKCLRVNDNIIGQNINQLFDGKKFFPEDILNGNSLIDEITWEYQTGILRNYEILQRPLTNKKGLLVGRLISITDITHRKQNEEQLVNDRILLRTILDNLPVSVYVKDLKGRKILANKTDLEYMGLEKESQAIGKTDFDFFPQELAKATVANDNHVLKTGKSVLNKEELIFNNDGEERWVLTSKVPFRDNKGDILGILGIGRDISEWKKMQQEFAYSEERFRILAQTTSAAVFIYQAESYIYLNPAAERLTGYSLEEMKNMKFWEIVHPDYKDLVRERGLNRLKGQEETRHYEFKIIAKDGKEKWIDYSTGTAYFMNSLAAIGTSFDITERKMAEEALTRSEQRYRKIFENSNTGILQIYPDGQINNANQAFAAMLGYDSPEQLLAKGKFSDFFTDPNDLRNFFEQIHQEEVIKNFEFQANKTDGTKIWIIVNAWTNMASTTNPENFLIEGFFLDITDSKLSGEYQNEIIIARKSSETKNLFLANMSHEIRTPVTGIIGMADILSRTRLSIRQKEYLTTIEESSQKLLQIINEILDISKIEAGKMELRPESFDLAKMMCSIRNMFSHISKKRNLYLEFDLSQNIPNYVLGDKKRIEQILMNLISNGLKFTYQGGVCVKVISRLLPTGLHQIRFEVTDTGLGIKPIDQVKLFRKFTQLDNSLTRTSEGTGLGLFICKELVKLMKGDIGVESTPGTGSTFWFEIPLEQTQKANVSDHSEQRNNAFFNNLNILVVDDKFVNQKVLALMLEGEGCIVDIASNGLEAQSVYNPGKHQLIFMDIMMPVMDGVTAMKELRKNHHLLPPIIALTANAMEGDAENYLKSGFNDYLPKPVSREDLQNTILKWTLAAGKQG
jgi:PAS domain S-box-containing protein